MVLNPSHGTMQIFDINGKTIMYSDLLNELGQFLNKSEYTEEELLVKNDLDNIAKYIDEEGNIKDKNEDVTHQQIEKYLEYFGYKNPKSVGEKEYFVETIGFLLPAVEIKKT